MDVNEGNFVQMTNWEPYAGISKNETDPKVGLRVPFWGYIAVDLEVDVSISG